MARCSLHSLLLALAFMSSAAVAYAAEPGDESAREQARELGYAGVQAYQVGDYAGANERLARAYRLLPAPSLGLWSARALSQLGQLVEAAARYAEVGRLPLSGSNAAIQRQAQGDAERELSLLIRRIPRAKFRVLGAPAVEVSLAVDGVSVPASQLEQERQVNPGLHRVSALRGEQRVELTFQASEGKLEEVPLDFGSGSGRADRARNGSAQERASTSAARTRETLAWVGVGVGGASVVFGTIVGALALSKKESLEESGNCRDGHCSSVERDRVASYNSLRTLSSVGFIAGGAFAATGVALLLVPRSSQKPGASASGRGLSLGLRANGAVLNGGF